MLVIDRNGKSQAPRFDKITERLIVLSSGLSNIIPEIITQKVVIQMTDKMKTSDLDMLSADIAVNMNTVHPEYSMLAARILISDLHKKTSDDWMDVCNILLNNINEKTGEEAPLMSNKVHDFISSNIVALSAAIDYTRDYTYDYFGIKTLIRSYLMCVNNKIVERVQHMLMRVACGIHIGDVDAAIETYDLMSTKVFTHATPTLFNAGTTKPQMSSCFLLTMKDDSICGIYDTLKTCALISKSAGGIGLSIHDIRASGSYIRGTAGYSNGVIPMLRVFNNTARYVDQGGGKRKGAIAIYLEPWHPDIEEFLELRKNGGTEELRTRDLFLALWIPDLFMRCVKSDSDWHLFCPDECPGLSDTHSKEFEQLYKLYKSQGRARRIVKARTIWKKIIDSQIETGTPYMLYKDACNSKSNQQNLGTIKSSNLCTEIIEYSSPEEVAVCNLASISLKTFVVEMDGGEDGELTFDHEQLYETTIVIAKNLDKIIDENYYPVEEARASNMRHRPIGIGVQGLADVFLLMHLPYASDAAKKLNKEIFETIYFAACTASNELAKIHGPYSTFKGSPASKGILQFDMWGVKPSMYWDWDALKSDIKKFGLRNSLLTAPMPTASTSQILGNNECFEPFTSNIYLRRTLAGEFIVISKYLVDDLSELGLWSTEMKDRIITNNGSVQGISDIPKNIQEIHKTVWEIKQKDIIDMAADRGAFIDQSQSMNIHMENANYGRISSMHFYGWNKGLKTGMYYLRSKPASNAIKFSLVGKKAVKTTPLSEQDKDEALTCSIENRDECLSCGS